MPLQEKYINLLTDFGFKMLFGTEANKDLLIDFLNQLLPPHHQIENLSYSKNEQLGKNIESRKAIYDIHCTAPNGEYFIVELQRTKQTFFKDRCLYYSTFPIQNQAKKGDWDFELNAVYTISILDFALEDYLGNPKMVHRVQLKDEEGNIFYPKLSYIYIELPKFTKTLEELETRFEKWLFVFRWINKLQTRPKALQERIFEKLFNLAQIANLSDMERMNYEQSLKQYRDTVNSLAYAKKEGREEGLEIGREENQLEVIKNAIQGGFSIDQISIITKLPVEQIEKIIAENNWELK